ncbi:MAG: alpha/beta fold hydrolase [Aphanocapsa sp. GSE-SYN-MK-11-07L]|jgi:hypothetical protein|nr:alpha/beta fold hydrolase [Aphanocapsa sp. GSE-SYN-MK-11-07L]
MLIPAYSPPWWLRNGLALTLYTALWQSRRWQTTIAEPQPPYQSHVFTGADGVPIYGWIAKPELAHATIIGTYGITGSLDNQWFLQILGRQAFAAGFAVVLFDWRGHGQTAALSPTLTSDGLYEGTDFIQIAAQAKQMGCPAPLWFTGYSLGGQLALWGVKAAAELDSASLNLSASEIGGAAVICPNLESQRSLTYLLRHPLGRYLERAIAKELKKLAWQINAYHPGSLDPEAIERANHIIEFDHELVIGRLGFPDVEAYYQATSPLYILPHLNRPTLILYAADDPMFIPTLADELKAICAENPCLELILTPHGGHVSHFSSPQSQQQAGDPDPWWAWHRILNWFQEQAP